MTISKRGIQMVVVGMSVCQSAAVSKLARVRGIGTRKCKSIALGGGGNENAAN
jgi:hypothetical protein